MWACVSVSVCFGVGGEAALDDAADAAALEVLAVWAIDVRGPGRQHAPQGKEAFRRILELGRCINVVAHEGLELVAGELGTWLK